MESERKTRNKGQKFIFAGICFLAGLPAGIISYKFGMMAEYTDIFLLIRNGILNKFSLAFYIILIIALSLIAYGVLYNRKNNLKIL